MTDVSTPTQKPTEVYAKLGLIFAFIFAPLGLIYSIKGLKKIRKDPNLGGKGLALAGLVISVVGTAAWITVFMRLIEMATGTPIWFGVA